ncbi:MAG: GspE/PulE family protein [Patescibacteria group bacterium]|nr:GspE/PulE family protein [Patescibacteria group bacterium]MCL5257721.1 GspE/PulE family protein [Patescibacteria group bacterium]
MPNVEETLTNKIKELYPDQIQSWLEAAKERKVGLEEYLYQTNRVSGQEILKIKKEIFKLPVKVFNQDEIIDEKVLTIIPENTAKVYQIVAFDHRNNEVDIGVVNPNQPNLTEAIEFIKTSLRVEPKIFLISFNDFYFAIRQYHLFSKELKGLINQFRERKPYDQTKEIVRLTEEVLPTEEAPVIKLIEFIISEGVAQKVSDVHLEPLSDRTRLRFRIQGDLKTVAYFPKDIHYQLINRIKILADMKIEETRVPQDGRFRAWVEDREIDFRVGILPVAGTEKVAIRVLDPSVGLKRLPEIGVSDFNFDKIKAAIKRPFGMILISGPTGSGKTTSLYAMLQELNKENVNLVSLEDPVEYEIDGVNQSQVKPEINYTFATGLREILRQDPDIILVGEIRDRETAELAVHASLTGHLVLSTIHTNNALGTITRLVDIGIERFLLPQTILLLISQRLARRLCDDCKVKKDADENFKKIINESFKNLPGGLTDKYAKGDNYQIYYPQGCQKCNFKGFVGRIGIFEVVLITDEIKNAVYQGLTEEEVAKLLPKQNFISLRQDGILKALAGLVNLEEIVKIT